MGVRRSTLSGVVALLLALSALAEDPPPAPKGFAWKRIESVKASFLVPEGWHFKEETKDGTRAFFITKEDIDKNGTFETGLSVNVQTLKKDPAQERAAAFVGEIITSHEVLESWGTETGVMKAYACRVRRVSPEHSPLIIQALAIGNSRTNTLYLIFFESPESSWDAAWKQGEPILTSFLLDDAV